MKKKQQDFQVSKTLKRLNEEKATRLSSVEDLEKSGKNKQQTHAQPRRRNNSAILTTPIR